jgi:hypothetical protein
MGLVVEFERTAEGTMFLAATVDTVPATPTRLRAVVLPVFGDRSPEDRERIEGKLHELLRELGWVQEGG